MFSIRKQSWPSSGRNLRISNVFFIAVAGFLSPQTLGNHPDSENPSEYRAKEPTLSVEEFGLTIRSTPHRSPQEEKSLLNVPQGFEIDLIASEPQIVKPLNIAFDKQGRLWVSQTHLYPFPAKEGEKASDSIIVLEDKDRDGDFESRKVFVDDLNIPMGLLPVDDGVICFSIPNIWHLKDTDGDGVCDERKILYGPFDTTRDTHGLVNSLRDGGDGWIYACHGFNNQSRVAGTDGHSVWLPSGNVFRFRPDGSRIELYSQGQVNPFGMVQDAFGNWFSADCHSKPISQLIQGGSYQSFGRPHDGLGFAPDIMDHLHGSTAIAGLAHTIDSKFPASMKDQLLSGNVMTCRINRNQLVYRGATAKAIELPDLVTSDDPWFRPVDLTFGPDGHLYIADFYNGIIGHYEVPLDHPGRDRTSGRIWRVRWTGDGETELAKGIRKSESLHDWSSLDSLDLESTADAMKWCQSIQRLSQATASEEAVAWFARNVDRMESLSDPIARQTFLIAFRRTLQNLENQAPDQFEKCLNATIHRATDSGVQVRLCHVLLNVLPACRSHQATLAAIELLKRISQQYERSSQDKSLGEFAWGIDRIAEIVDDDAIVSFLELVQSLGKSDHSNTSDTVRFARMLESIGVRQLQAKGAFAPQLKAVASKTMDELAGGLLNDLESDKNTSIPLPLISVGSNSNDSRVWGYEIRKIVVRENGETRIHDEAIQSSFNLGEAYTGRLVSPPFKAGKTFGFNIAGHSGVPPRKLGLNVARLSLWNGETGALQTIFEQAVPVNDVAQPVHWNLSDYEGQDVVFEVVDADANPSYAWIAVANFSDSRFRKGAASNTWQTLRKLTDLYGLPENSVSYPMLVGSSKLDPLNRFLLLKNQLKSEAPVPTILTDVAIAHQFWDLLLGTDGVGQTIPTMPMQATNAQDWENAWDKLAPKLFARLSARAQSQMVQSLASNRTALLKVADWIQNRALPVDVLRAIPENQWSVLSSEELERFSEAKGMLAEKKDRSGVIEKVLQQTQIAKPDIELGRKVYAEKCAQCHKFGNVGLVVGPQLEGIGNRGAERLLEDILWPDRNVDEAFRVSLVLLEDGTSLSGLIIDRSDSNLTLVDQNGVKHVLLTSEIEQEKHSALSLMPSNMEELMTPQEIASLLEYLKTGSSVAQ